MQSTKYLILLWVVLLNAYGSLAIKLPSSRGLIQTPEDFSSQPLVNDASSQFTVAIAPVWTSLSYTDRSKTGIITLGVNHHFPYFSGQYTTEVKIALTTYATLSGSGTTDTITLNLTYYPNDSLSFNDKSSYVFQDVEKYDMELIEVKVNGSSQGYLSENLYIQGDILVDRVYDFSSQIATAVTITSSNSDDPLDVDCDTVPDEYVISWDAVPGAEEYQVEWVFINDYDKAIGDLEVDFRLNATRISTTSTAYHLALIFDKGYICYRVRAVGRSISDVSRFQFTPWSTADGPTGVSSCDYFHQTLPFDVLKNWQYSATYAEEGKKKEVLSFFDGSLRNRQMVTRINSDDHTIVGETIYDHQGRPAVQVLPVPVPATDCENPEAYNSLKFYEKFTRKSATEAYTKLDFDTSAVDDSCSTVVGPMHTSSGASNYYSSSNPDQTGYQGYVPDAAQYPFSQVEYTPDNTGRISRQGGVGADFQLGSGHETSYFYGHPFQEQLDRLFGSEVGDATHYQKNMVIDPNGQISVSYLDQEGRVIATSLAGEAPDNVEALNSAGDPDTMTVNLFAPDLNGVSNSNVDGIDGLSKVFNQTVLLSSNTSLEINYDIYIEPYRDSCMDSSICFNCVYDLQIEVRDLCGRLVSPVALSAKKTGHFEHDSLNNILFQTACDDYSFDTTFVTDVLSPGSYQITKILTVNQDAIEAYVAMALNDSLNSCFTSYEDFLSDIQSNTPNTCDTSYSCAECVANLGTLEDYLAAGGTQEHYAEELEACNAPCQPVSYYETMRKLLLGDVMPGGQYGEYIGGTGTQVSNYPVSVLNLSNSLPKSPDADWKHPKYDLENTLLDHYYEEDGVTLSRIYLNNVIVNVSNEVTSSDPAVDAAALIDTKVFWDSVTSAYYTYPEYLLQVDDFISYYQSNEQWANSLIYYHPEYPILSYYRTFTEVVTPGDRYTSESFDAAMMEVNTWDEAVAAGFIKSTYLSEAVNDRLESFMTDTTHTVWDPFAFYDDTLTALQDKVADYIAIGSTHYSMMEYAAVTTRCTNLALGATPATPCTLWGSDYGTDATENAQIRDQEWIAFRSLYYSVKQQIQQAQITRWSIDDPEYYGYNACIGNEDFNPFENNFFSMSSWPFGGQFHNTEQPCSASRMALYQQKQIRFGFPAYLANMSPADVAYQTYLLTGQCPNAVSLQAVLNEAAGQHELDSTGFSLNDLNAYSGLLLSLNNFDLGTTNTATDWTQTTATSTVLEFLWEESGGAPFATFRIVKDTADTLGYTWSDVMGLTHLYFTGESGGLYTFSAIATVQIGTASYQVPISGNTTLPIGNCSFDDVCEQNDLGHDLELLLEVITGLGDLQSNPAINLSDTANYAGFLTNRILNAVSPGLNGDLTWHYNASLPGFELGNTTNSSYLRLGINSFSPSTFTIANLGLIDSIGDLVVGPNNTFDLVSYDVDGNYLVTIHLDLVRMTAGGIESVSIGNCGLPNSLLCAGQAYTNFDDLTALLEDVLLHQDTNYNLGSSSLVTANLEHFIDTSTTDLSGTITHDLSGGQELSFSFHDSCNLVLHYDSIPGLSFAFDSIIAVEAVHTSGAEQNDGHYYGFEMTVLIAQGDSTEAIILSGSSCISLQECSVCVESTMPVYTATELDSIETALLSSGVLVTSNYFYDYQYYSDQVDTFNVHHGLTPLDTNYVNKLSYYEYFNQIAPYSVYEYLSFLTAFEDSVDSYWLAQNPGYFFSHYGQFASVSLSYSRYEGAVDYYNSQRDGITYDHITEVSLTDFTTTIYSENCSDYITYLLGHITNSGSTLSILYYPDTLTAQIPADSCTAAYSDYVSAYLDYMTNNPTCQSVDNQLLSYTQFQALHLCCTDAGMTALEAYIYQLHHSTSCDLIPPGFSNCLTPEEQFDQCSGKYSTYYLSGISDFNSCDWAVAHGITLTNEFTSDTAFFLAGYCDCAKYYQGYLFGYIYAQATDSLPTPIGITAYCGEQAPTTYVACDEAYEQYTACVAMYNSSALANDSEDLISALVSKEQFMIHDLCNCVDDYCAQLNRVTDSLLDFDLLPDLLTFCSGIQSVPCSTDSTNFSAEPFITTFTDPCQEFYESATEMAAYTAYQQQVQAIQTALSTNYIAHCLGAVEDMTMKYQEIEHHFTLYYYDQAGNLVKTVPPEGVEFIAVSNPDIAEALLEDRANNTHQVLTSHRMATTYLYNSLNQLVAQNMPDQDAMTVFEVTLPNGLPKKLFTTAIQMVSANKGYLTGYIPVKAAPMGTRGYLFETNNGGQNWTRVTNTLASDLKCIRMYGSYKGVAVGASGILLKTSDSGGTWDLVDTYSSNIQGAFVALEVSDTVAYALVENGNIYQYNANTGDFSLYEAAPINTDYTVLTFRDFSMQENYTSAAGIIYLAQLQDASGTFDAIIRNDGSSGYEVEKVRVADLNAISFYGASSGVIAGEDGNVSRLSGTSSTNFIQELVVSGVLGTINEVVMLNANVGIARIEKGSRNVIRTTVDGGSSWQALSDDYDDARLSLIKRNGSTTMEVLLQGTASGQMYTKTVFLTASGIVSELEQTPNVTQTFVFETVYAYQDGANTTIFGIGSDHQLYRSNTYTTAGTTLTYSLVSGTGVLSTTSKQLLVTNTGSGIAVYALLTDGTLKRTTATSVSASYASFATVSGPASLVWLDVMNLSGTNYVTGYNSSYNRIYAHSAATGGTMYYFSTILTLGSASINKLAVHGNQITLVGTEGGIFTSGAVSIFPLTDGGAGITFTAREDHRLPELISIHTVAPNLLIAGVNGTLLKRTMSASASTVTLHPLNTLSDLHAANAYTGSLGTYFLAAGSNGYARQFDTTTWVGNDLVASTGLTLEQQANGATFHDIAVSGEKISLVGDQGMVFYNETASTQLFVKTVPLTGNDLWSTCFASTGLWYAAGTKATVLRYYNAQGSVINRLFSPLYRDVHFEDGQLGTLIGDHFLVRTTDDGGLTWKVNLPGTSLTLNASNMNNLRKTWTRKGANNTHFALVGGIDYLTTVSNGIFTNTSFTGNTSDIQFTPNAPKGYISYNNAIKGLNLVPSGNTYTLSVTPLTFATASDSIYAIHVFDNQSVAYVGASGIIGYFNKSTSSSYTLATISGGTFRDVYFHDDISGYAVGDNGAFYYLNSISNDNLTHAINPGGLTYAAQLIDDPEIGTATDYSITALAFGTRNSGVYGGYYTNGTYIGTKKSMVRLLHHEGGLYTARFYYDRLGRIVVSQNSRQLAASKYSYTLYDELGRVYEAGEKTENTATITFPGIFGTYVGGLFVPSVIDDANLASWLNTEATTTRKEVTRSYYDASNLDIAAMLPATLNEATQRKRIVHVTYEAVYDGLDSTYDHATHYDYDIHGNVKTLLQDNQLLTAVSGIEQHRFKRMDYTYDLISGNVHRVDYETGHADQWHHAYSYDADNRITDVYTSKETPLLDESSSIASLENEPVVNPLWDQEAAYSYYAHGPLARTVLGAWQVQGQDYVYTLQGWIKGVNSNTLDVGRDPGSDGALAATDAYGYSLHYFEGDYTAIGGNNSFIASQSGSDLVSNSNDLYNGNIGRMVTTITDPNTREVLPLGNAYQYDQLNRIKESRSYDNINLSSNSWGSSGSVKYYNAFTYDANGNIETQVRKNHTNTTIDSLSYQYHDVGGKRIRNRLYQVSDGVSSGTFGDDIDDMGTFYAADTAINVSNNYVYDGEGRLIKDRQEEIDSIIWRVDGKVKKIIRPLESSKKNVSFDYDAMGHRIAKHSYTAEDVLERSTYYLLDAQGNVMSTYDYVVDTVAEEVTFAQKEKHIYGSSRLGTMDQPVPMFATQNNTYTLEYVYHRIGNRLYELTNHLGNVLSVVSDKAIPDVAEDTVYSNDFSSSLSPFIGSGTVVLSLASGKMKAAGVNQWEKAYINLTTVVGEKYRVTCDLDLNSSGNLALFAHDYSISSNLAVTNASSNGTYQIEFTAVSTTTHIAVQNSDVSTRDFYVDNFVIVSTNEINEFIADIRKFTDYSPFGVTLEGRDLALTGADGYRYGFNDMEKDDELKGSGNSYDFGARMLDPRLGRFFSLDQYSRKYPYYSPYIYAGNTPIWATDVNGDSVWVYSNTIDKSYGIGRHMFMRVKTGDIDVLIEMSGPAKGQKIGQVKVSPWDPAQLTSRSNVMFHQVWEPINQSGVDKFEKDIIKYANFFENSNTYQDLNKDGKMEVVANPNLPKYDKWGPNSNGFTRALIEFAGGTLDFKTAYNAFPVPELLPGALWFQLQVYFKPLFDKYGKDEYYLNNYGMTLEQFNAILKVVQAITNQREEAQSQTANPSAPADNTKVVQQNNVSKPKKKSKKKSGV